MRLVCPNCAAQYEVDASVLPAEGTEVQCSACSTVWFQPGPDIANPAPRPKQQAPVRQPRSEPEPAQAVVETTQPARPSRPPVAAPDASSPDTQQRAAPAPQSNAQRTLDPAVANVLREEAEFEAKLRATEKSSLEMQEELGLFGPSPVASDPVQARSGASSLPDIDDISSTLEPLEAGRAGLSGLPQTEAARKRSFLAGLGVPVAMAVLLAGLYLLAPALAAAVPALEAPLGSYVALVDTARLAVAGLLNGAP